MSKKQQINLAFALAKKRYSVDFPNTSKMGLEDGVQRADASFKRIASATTRRKIIKLLEG